MDPLTQHKVGDICSDCQLKGIESRLRYFLINLNEDTLLKCESDSCMYPYNDDLLSSSDGEEFYESNFTNLLTISTTHILPNEFHNNANTPQTTVATAMRHHHQPDNFLNTLQNLKVEKANNSNEMSIKSEPNVSEAILFQYGTKSDPKATTTGKYKLSNTTLLQNIKMETDMKTKTKPKTKNDIKTEESPTSATVSNEATLFQFNAKASLKKEIRQKKPEIEIKTVKPEIKIKKKYKKKEPKVKATKASSSPASSLSTENTTETPSTSATSLPLQVVKCESNPVPMVGIPKASLIKGHEYLKLIEATKKTNTTFKPLIKKPKKSIQEQTSSEDEIYNE